MSVALLLAWLSPEPPALFPSVSFLYRPHVSLSPSSGFSRLNTASPMWLSSQIISSDVCCLQFPVVLFMLVFESFSPSILSLLSLLHRDSPAYSSSRSQSFLISIIWFSRLTCCILEVPCDLISRCTAVHCVSWPDRSVCPSVELIWFAFLCRYSRY